MNRNDTANSLHLESELKKTQRELTILYEISNAMRTTLDLDHILYIILTGVTAHAGLGFNRAILFLYNDQQHCLETKMAIGPKSTEQAYQIWYNIYATKQHLTDLIAKDNLIKNKHESDLYKSVKGMTIKLDPLDQTLLGKVFYDGHFTHIKSTDFQKFPSDPFLKIFHSQEMIIMPLKAHDKVNGIIVADNAFNQRPISHDDLRIFEMLANQAGLAIENSRLFELVKLKSHKDPVTDLWNHGFFQSQLESEFQLLQITQTPLSLMMLDIDDFKKLNDAYGHQYGDIILKEISRILTNSSRNLDYVCRYGGEEFAIILNKTSNRQAYEIAERIRQNIATQTFPTTPSGETIHVTVSIGIATAPENTSTKDELIKLADIAMYKAKFSGKNTTYVTE